MQSKCKDPKIGALLHAYELRALSEKDTERFEIHLMACDHCFNRVQAFEAPAALLQSDETVMNLLREADLEAPPARGKTPGGLLKYLWPDIPFIFKPALAYLLVLVLLIPAFSGLKKSPERGVRPIQSIQLTPFRSSETSALTRETNLDGLIQFVFSDAVPGEIYEVRIETEAGRIIYQNKSFDGFDAFGTGQLLVPAAGMEPGRYRLMITDPRADAPSNRQIYSFLID